MSCISILEVVIRSNEITCEGILENSKPLFKFKLLKITNYNYTNVFTLHKRCVPEKCYVNQLNHIFKSIKIS